MIDSSNDKVIVFNSAEHLELLKEFRSLVERGVIEVYEDESFEEAFESYAYCSFFKIAYN